MKLYMLELGVFRAFREFVCKRYSDTFSDLFSEKGRRKSYASLLSFMFVHQVLASQQDVWNREGDAVAG